MEIIRAETLTDATVCVKRAHAVWDLRRAVLAEAEKRFVDRLDVYARSGEGSPADELQTLKLARAECTEAFDALMHALDEAAVWDRESPDS